MPRPDHFHLLQNTLRDSYNERGINLSSPNGVTIHGKDYGAINKHLDIYEDGDSHATFHIPFENGTMLQVSSWGGKSLPYLLDQDDHVLASQLHVPTIHLHGDGTKTYRHGPALHVGVDAFHNRHSATGSYGNATDIHDVINTYSKIPHQGTYDWDYSKEGSAAFLKVRPNATSGLFGVDEKYHELNPEELNEHRSNFKFNPHHGPSYISTTFDSEPSPGRDHRYDIRTDHHRYDIRTEQLLPISEKELPNH